MKTKFLDPKDVEVALKEIAVKAEYSGCAVALVGGVAMSLYGSDRMTRDVDFVCSSLGREDWLAKVDRRLKFGGVAGVTASGCPVDLIFRTDDYAPLYEEALHMAMPFEALPVKVVSPEHLAALKMAAGREKDELDLKTLIRLGVLHLETTEIILRRHLGVYAVREFKSLCDEVAWLKSRED